MLPEEEGDAINHMVYGYLLRGKSFLSRRQIVKGLRGTPCKYRKMLQREGVRTMTTLAVRHVGPPVGMRVLATVVAGLFDQSRRREHSARPRRGTEMAETATTAGVDASGNERGCEIGITPSPTRIIRGVEVPEALFLRKMVPGLVEQWEAAGMLV